MPPSESFRNSLKAGRLQEAFLLAMGQVIELKVTTWVASERDITTTATGHRLQTRIDLVQGDIENEIGDRFLTDTAYQDLHQFHRDQVADGSRIIRQNIHSLQKLFAVLGNVQGETGDNPRSGMSSSSVAVEPASPNTISLDEPVAPSAPWELSEPEPDIAFTESEPDWPDPNSGYEPPDPFADLDWPPPGSVDPVPEPWMADESPDYTPPPPVPFQPESPLIGSEEEEDWGEFVEFVEETTIEPLPHSEEASNPFALPLEDADAYTSVVEEDWFETPDPVPPPPPPRDRRDWEQTP